MAKTDKPGERIAKALARRGVASRRAAEAMIAEGRVSVNGRVIDSPALDVGPRDRIAVDGKPVAAPPPPRLWLYHKPPGLVTTEKDELGRPTVFAALPPEMGRVLSVGRLDLNSEGLLLLTNDGGLKRKLELPSTGWLRKYRVRVNGTPSDDTLAPLRRGIEVEGERFQPMEVALDRQQGANAWLTVGIREGRNREVRRAMEAVGLTVNRLIRISYGPFRLGELAPGAVEPVRAKVLRDQLGIGPEAADDEKTGGARRGPGGAAAGGRRKPQGRDRASAGTGAPWDPQGSGTRPPGKRGPGKRGAGAAGSERDGAGDPRGGKAGAAKRRTGAASAGAPASRRGRDPGRAGSESAQGSGDRGSRVGPAKGGAKPSAGTFRRPGGGASDRPGPRAPRRPGGPSPGPRGGKPPRGKG